jgi:tetratricopeptide (TPR) repeat protein
MAELRVQIAAASRMLKEAATPENMQKAVEKLVEIYKVLEEKGYIDQFRSQMESLMKQAVDMLVDCANDLMAQTQQAIKEMNARNLQKIAESIKILEECLNDLKQVSCESISKQLSQLETTLKTAKKDYETAVKTLTKAIVIKLKELSDNLRNADTQQEFRDLYEALQVLGGKIYDIGKAGADQKDYDETVDEFIDVQKDVISEIDDRVYSSVKKSAVLTARSIHPDFSTKVSFSGGKAYVTLTLAKDELAGGYDLKVNGQDVELTEKNGSLTYTFSNAKVGAKYNFELTPYVFCEYNGKTEKISGYPERETVVPKVSLSQAKVKKAKAGTESIKVKWAKVKGADGYKIRFKADGKTRTVTVKGGAKTSRTVKELASGKYSVKVRAYKVVDGKKYYGKWSKVKKVRVK